MTDLKPINFGINQFCGPAVLSALTGKTTDECAQVISSISGARTITAVQVTHLLKAFEKLGFKTEKMPVPLTSLYANLTAYANKPGKYMVLVPHHVVAIEVKDGEVYLIDNHSKEPIDARGSARLMQKVEQIYKLTELPKPVLLRTEVFITRPTILTLEVISEDIYENPKDNKTYHVGTLSARNSTELLSVLMKLTEEYQ